LVKVLTLTRLIRTSPINTFLQLLPTILHNILNKHLLRHGSNENESFKRSQIDFIPPTPAFWLSGGFKII
jgi:hypothetical protein